MAGTNQNDSLSAKLTGQIFSVPQFSMKYNVVLTFESMNEIKKCGISNKRSSVFICSGAVYNGHIGVSNFQVCK